MTALVASQVHRESWYRESLSRESEELAHYQRKLLRGELTQGEAQRTYALLARTGMQWAPEALREVFRLGWEYNWKSIYGPRIMQEMSNSGVGNLHDVFLRQYNWEEEHRKPFQDSWFVVGPYAGVIQFYGTLQEAFSELNKGYVEPRTMMALLELWEEFQRDIPKWREEYQRLTNAKGMYAYEWEANQRWLKKNPDITLRLRDWISFLHKVNYEVPEVHKEMVTLKNGTGVRAWDLLQFANVVLRKINTGEPLVGQQRKSIPLLADGVKQFKKLMQEQEDSQK